MRWSCSSSWRAAGWWPIEAAAIVEAVNAGAKLLLIDMVDPHQGVAIGCALLLARHKFAVRSLSPTDLAHALSRELTEKGRSILLTDGQGPGFLAIPRRMELAGALDRLRNLRVRIGQAFPG
ncbi:MAG: hypothetical protein P8010_00790 [Desulfosarcinaceae bacterium]